MASLSLFSTGTSGKGYPQYTPIEPDTWKIEETDTSFDIVKTLNPNMSYIDPVSMEGVSATGGGYSKATPTQTIMSIPKAKPAMSVVSTASAESVVAQPQVEVPNAFTTPATPQAVRDSQVKTNEETTRYLHRAQFATGVKAASEIAQGIITLANANAGVDAVERTAKMREINLEQSEALLYENMRDTIAQLDMISAAKNVDLSSSAIVGQKERGLSDMGKDVRSKQLAVKFQNAVDKYNAIEQKKAAQTQGNLQIAQGMLTAASLFI